MTLYGAQAATARAFESKHAGPVGGKCFDRALEALRLIVRWRVGA